MTLENINIKLLYQLESFNVFNFKRLNYDERISLIMEFSNSICKQYELEIPFNNFKFLSREELYENSPGYNSNTKQIILDKTLINKSPICREDVFYILDSVIHETTHYIQDKLGLFLDILQNPLSTTPYYLFQEHEEDAFDSSFYVLEKIIPSIDSDFEEILKDTQDMFYDLKNKAKEQLISQGYGVLEMSDDEVKQQITNILPFHKDYCKFIKLEKNLSIERTNIENHGVKLEIIEDDTKWLCDISMPSSDGTNHLYCSIDEVCKVNAVCKRNYDDKATVNINDKESLMIILNKVINVYNERHKLCPCQHIEIVPISLVDNKADHNRFATKDYKITKVIEPEISSANSITMAEIRNGCQFGSIDQKIAKAVVMYDESITQDKQNIDDINI